VPGQHHEQLLFQQGLDRHVGRDIAAEQHRKIQQAAGLRRTQMELGSIACTILCDDARLETALPKIVNAGYRKAGQVCTSVHEMTEERIVTITTS
jgi:acyl-CoA reductase-like NAD-dependent aldehyde dehydrogenase